MLPEAPKNCVVYCLVTYFRQNNIDMVLQPRYHEFAWRHRMGLLHLYFLSSPWCKSVNSRPSEIGFWFGDRIWMRREAGRFGVSLRSRADFGR